MNIHDVNRFAQYLCQTAADHPSMVALLMQRIAEGYPFCTIAEAVGQRNAVHLSEAACIGIAGADSIIEHYQRWVAGDLLPF